VPAVDDDALEAPMALFAVSAIGGAIRMFVFSDFARNPLRVLGAIAALLMGSTLVGQRAEALSPINPGISKARANELTIEVRGGHGGGGGGGGGGGRGGFSGHSVAPGSFSSGVVRGGMIGAAPAVGAAPTVAPRFAGHVTGAPGFAGHRFFHHRHFHGVFIGGVYYDDYPYDDPDYYVDYPDNPPVYSVPAFVGGAGCRRVLTVQGPRVFCHHRVAPQHRIHRRHHSRRHHRA
jgi:hypothetical protein